MACSHGILGCRELCSWMDSNYTEMAVAALASMGPLPYTQETRFARMPLACLKEAGSLEPVPPQKQE